MLRGELRMVDLDAALRLHLSLRPPRLILTA